MAFTQDKVNTEYLTFLSVAIAQRLKHKVSFLHDSRFQAIFPFGIVVGPSFFIFLSNRITEIPRILLLDYRDPIIRVLGIIGRIL